MYSHASTTTKRCCTCRQDLPLDAFAICRAARDGRQAKCRACFRAYLATYDPLRDRTFGDTPIGGPLHVDRKGETHNASQHGAPWTADDDAIATDPELSGREAARLLRRSVSAVYQRRGILRAAYMA